MEKVIRDGKVAVLVSPGYGGSWSTSAYTPEQVEWLTFAPEVVAWVEAGKPGGDDALDAIVDKRFAGLYLGGGHTLEIEWVPVGSVFRIDEYDGFEAIEFRDQVDWLTA